MHKLSIDLLEQICINLNYRSICNFRLVCKNISISINAHNYIYRYNSKLLFYNWIAKGYLKQFNEIYKPWINLTFILKNDNKEIDQKIEFIRNTYDIKNNFALMIIYKQNEFLKEIIVKNKIDAIRHIRNLLVADFKPCNIDQYNNLV